jgi:hypothetical protein
MPPFLAGLLDDPYDAVRFITRRSLSSLPAYQRLRYDAMWPSARRQKAAADVLEIWQQSGVRTRDRALLFHSDGAIDAGLLTRLLAARDNRRIALRE